MTVLSDRQVRELAGRRGMTVGAHGVNHLLLPRQPADVQDREMRECRAALEGETNRPVTLFAYPYGAADRSTASLARRLFDYACDCTAAAVGATFDAARVPRLDVKHWTAEELRSRLDALCAPNEAPRILSFLP